LKQGQVVLGFSLPSNQEPTKAVVPAVGALDDPATGYALVPAHQWRLPTTPGVADDAPTPQAIIHDLVVVALIEAAILRASSLGSGRIGRGPIDRWHCHPHIGHICSAEREPEWDPAPVCEDVPLRPTLGAICGVRAREVPPFGALTMALSREVQFHPMPFFTS
jgi:hypothetical protein